MCDRCEELEERVAWLESELGLQQAADLFDRLRSAMSIPGPSYVGRRGPVALISALYAARGRTMSRLQLAEALPPTRAGDERGEKIIDVWVCFARKCLGADAVANVWGKGYRLTAEGMTRVAAILEPPQTADVLRLEVGR